MFEPPPPNENDIGALAALHHQSLPTSGLSWLGEGYLRAFYRYVKDSEDEAVVVHRDQAGRIVAAAVIAWQPAGLLHRLLLRTPMLLYLILHAPWVAVGFFRRMRTLGKSVSAMPDDALAQAPHAPELVDFYTAPDQRGRGCGTALLSQCEQFLRRRKETRYWVKTEDVVGNRAIDFYRRNELVPLGTIRESETRFIVLLKSLNGNDPGVRVTPGRQPARAWLDLGEIFRFLLAGGTNALFTLAVYEAMLFVVSYDFAYAICWICGLIFAGVVYPNRVFRVPQASIVTRMVTVGGLVAVYFIGVAMLQLLQLIGVSPRLGILMVLPVTSSLGYAALRFLLHVNSRSRAPAE